MKWVIKFLNNPEKKYIVESDTGDNAIKKACEETNIEYNPRNQPSCAFMCIENEEDLKYFI